MYILLYQLLCAWPFVYIVALFTAKSQILYSCHLENYCEICGSYHYLTCLPAFDNVYNEHDDDTPSYSDIKALKAITVGSLNVCSLFKNLDEVDILLQESGSNLWHCKRHSAMGICCLWELMFVPMCMECQLGLYWVSFNIQIDLLIFINTYWISTIKYGYL